MRKNLKFFYKYFTFEIFRNPYLYDMDFSSFFHSTKNSSTLRAFAIIIKIPLPCNSTPSWDDFSSIFMSRVPESGFFPVVRFFKKYIFGIYMSWEFPDAKFFTPDAFSIEINFDLKKISTPFLIIMDFYSLFRLVKWE